MGSKNSKGVCKNCKRSYNYKQQKRNRQNRTLANVYKMSTEMGGFQPGDITFTYDGCDGSGTVDPTGGICYVDYGYGLGGCVDVTGLGGYNYLGGMDYTGGLNGVGGCTDFSGLGGFNFSGGCGDFGGFGDMGGFDFSGGCGDFGGFGDMGGFDFGF